MRITWNTESLGPMSIVVSEDKVMAYMEALTVLNLNPEFTLDNDSERE